MEAVQKKTQIISLLCLIVFYLTTCPVNADDKAGKAIQEFMFKERYYISVIQNPSIFVSHYNYVLDVTGNGAQRSDYYSDQARQKNINNSLRTLDKYAPRIGIGVSGKINGVDVGIGWELNSFIGKYFRRTLGVNSEPERLAVLKKLIIDN